MDRRIGIGIVALALALLGCGSSTARGLDRPPAALDPASPTLAAEDFAFDRAELTVPAGEAFVVVFANRDSVDHNVSIYADEALRDRRFEGVLFSGPATRWYPVPPLAAGTYTFVCDLHPTMRGTLIAT